MTLKTYVDLYALLQAHFPSAEACRAFGLQYPDTKHSPQEQLHAWAETHQKQLPHPTLGARWERSLYHVTLLIAGVAFVTGVFTGIGLLHYSGDAPVNLIYFLFMALIFPLVTMFLALLSMVRANRQKNTLVHISPAYWLERLIAMLGKRPSLLDEIKVAPRLLNWIVIQRAQLASLLFSVGLLVALLAIVATQDVAFAWSTTLQIDAEGFTRFLQQVALPWRSWLPSAVPTLELVSQSQYYRLGGGLSQTMVEHAALLGAWWKFLAMATLVYAIGLRMLLYVVASWGVKRALAKGLVALEGVKALLQCMNEPLITTHTPDEAVVVAEGSAAYPRDAQPDTVHYDSIEGWSLSKEKLEVLCDALGVSAPLCVEVGGNNPLEVDRQIASEATGEVLVVVKAWEPPTMDFMDHLEMVASHAKKVVVMPVGTAKEGYTPQTRHKEVWLRKLTQADLENVWVAS